MSRLVCVSSSSKGVWAWFGLDLIRHYLGYRSVAVLESLGATVVAGLEPVGHGDLLDDFHRADFYLLAISDVRDDAAVVLLCVGLTLASTDHRWTNILDNVQVPEYSA
jgi:hypothetical protein